MERCDLDVLDVTAAVWPLVFKAHIRKVDVTVEERQIVLVRPLLDFSGITVRTSVGVTLVPVAVVEKLLILAFELVVEHHTLDPNVVFLKPFGSSHVGGVKLRVVRQFTGARVS
jgi:hypothetical protein